MFILGGNFRPLSKLAAFKGVAWTLTKMILILKPNPTCQVFQIGDTLGQMRLQEETEKCVRIKPN